jgi:uncharacterized delta-60 repeat protein
MYCTTLNRASLLILSILLIATQQAAAQAGQLDPTFGTGGVFVSNFAQGDVPNSDNAIALQSDGKIVLGGSTGNFAALVRLNTNGTLDTSFGSGGIVNNNFGVSDASVFGMAIQPDGKIVAAAAAFGGGGSVGRFNPDGSVDTTFGTGGFAISTALFSQEGTPNAFALQTDGKILVTGAGLIGRYTTYVSASPLHTNWS